MGSQEGDHGGDCTVWPAALAAPAYCSPPTRGWPRWWGPRTSEPRGGPVTDEPRRGGFGGVAVLSGGPCREFHSSRAIASRRAGHAPSPSTRPCSAARAAKGSLARLPARAVEPSVLVPLPDPLPVRQQQQRQCRDFASFAPSTCRSIIGPARRGSARPHLDEF